MPQPLLEQALRVSTKTRMSFLRNLSKAQRDQLQAEMRAEQAARGITPTPTATAPVASKISETRFNSIRSGSFIGGKRVVRVGRHLVTIPATAKWKRVRETAAYVYYRGVVSGYRADGAKLKKLTLDAATRAHIARTMFNIKI